MFVSEFLMFSARAVAGEVNTAVNDQPEPWTEKEKSHFFLGKVRLHVGLSLLGSY